MNLTRLKYLAGLLTESQYREVLSEVGEGTKDTFEYKIEPGQNRNVIFFDVTDNLGQVLDTVRVVVSFMDVDKYLFYSCTNIPENGKVMNIMSSSQKAGIYDLSGAGKPLKTISTVVKICSDLLNERLSDVVAITFGGTSDKRSRIYNAFLDHSLINSSIIKNNFIRHNISSMPLISKDLVCSRTSYL